MDSTNEKSLNAVDRFLSDLSKNGRSDVICPFCGTSLEYHETGSSYEVRCQTKNCLVETFRGI